MIQQVIVVMGIVDYISSSDLEKSVKNIYGDVSVEKTSFELDKNHYVFYDSTMMVMSYLQKMLRK